MSEFIKVTVTRGEYNEDTKQRIKDMGEAVKKSSSPINKNNKDDYGRDAKWYQEMGMDIPEELLDSSETQLVVTDEDMVFEDRDMYLRKSMINFFGDEFEEGCEIILNDGSQIIVKETAEQINKLITKTS